MPGDVVIFHPVDGVGSKDIFGDNVFIKRVVAVEGDTVEVSTTQHSTSQHRADHQLTCCCHSCKICPARLYSSNTLQIVLAGQMAPGNNVSLTFDARQAGVDGVNMSLLQALQATVCDGRFKWAPADVCEPASVMNGAVQL